MQTVCGIERILHAAFDVFCGGWECRWFRHKGDAYDNQKTASTVAASGGKKKLKRNVSSLSRVGYLSDSMPSLALRSMTNNPRSQTDNGAHRNRWTQLFAIPSPTYR